MEAKSILISGLGIAGPTLAYWLGRAGFEPTLVERAPSLRGGGYVIDFWGLGYEIAVDMGLADGLERVGYHMRELRIVDAEGVAIAGFGTKVFNELTGGRFITLGRSDLSRLLFETIEPGTEVVFGDEIVGLQEDVDGVTVQFQRASERRFDLVIGADGLHSNVRRLAFGPQEAYEKDLGYRVAAFEVRGYRPRDEEIYVIYNEPGRMLARFALHDDRTLFLFVLKSDDDAALDMTAQRALLHRRYAGKGWECGAILDQLDRTPELYFDRVSQIFMPRWTRGRVALVGDAAFCASLMAGQGSALAMTAAYVLAGELAKARGRHAEAFDAYEGLLRDYMRAKQSGAAKFSGALAPSTRWGLLFRNQVVKACALPGLARLAFGREIVDTLSLPQYPFANAA